MAIPEVEAGTFRKYDPEAPAPVRRYVGVQFLIVLAGAVLVLRAAPSLQFPSPLGCASLPTGDELRRASEASGSPQAGRALALRRRIAPPQRGLRAARRSRAEIRWGPCIGFPSTIPASA